MLLSSQVSQIATMSMSSLKTVSIRSVYLLYKHCELKKITFKLELLCNWLKLFTRSPFLAEFIDIPPGEDPSADGVVRP